MTLFGTADARIWLVGCFSDPCGRSEDLFVRCPSRRSKGQTSVRFGRQSECFDRHCGGPVTIGSYCEIKMLLSLGPADFGLPCEIVAHGARYVVLCSSISLSGSLNFHVPEEHLQGPFTVHWHLRIVLMMRRTISTPWLIDLSLWPALLLTD